MVTVGHPESQTWTFLLDGRIQQVVLEVDRSILYGWTYRIIVNAANVASAKPGPWSAAKFKIGKHKCRIETSGNPFSGYTRSLLIDGVDAGEYDPQRGHAPPQPVQHTFVRDREVVYERQVVVVRCKYCGILTPADFATCRGCGAPKFS
jgi:hypothetical protein